MMKADKSVGCPLVFRPSLFRGERRIAECYLDQWLITLIKRLLAFDFINQTWSTFSFLTPPLNNGRPHWVWPWGWESQPSVTDPCSILIHHAAWGLCVCVCVCVCVQGKLSKEEIERKRTTWCIPHRSYHLIIRMEWVSQCSTHTHTHLHMTQQLLAQDWGHVLLSMQVLLAQEQTLINPPTPPSNLLWHF